MCKSKICLICKKECETLKSLSKHIHYTHNIIYKDYYDRFLKKEGEDICRYCKINKTKFISGKYRIYCSCKCSANCPEHNSIKKQKLMEKYGVDNPSLIKEVQQKRRQTNLDRYGKTCTLEHQKFKEKKEQTWLKKYGTKNPLNIESINVKRKHTILEKYNVENVSQSAIIHNKKLTNSFQKKRYTLPSGIIINLLGYEPQFLDYIFQNNILKEEEIEYEILTISYKINDKKHIYYPDFYIPKYNLIVEIKNSYLAERDKDKIHYKKQEIISRGYNFIMIVNNNFEEFNNLIKLYEKK